MLFQEEQKPLIHYVINTRLVHIPKELVQQIKQEKWQQCLFLKFTDLQQHWLQYSELYIV